MTSDLTSRSLPWGAFLESPSGSSECFDNGGEMTEDGKGDNAMVFSSRIRRYADLKTSSENRLCARI